MSNPQGINPRLIAQAPAMLEALKDFVSWCDANDWGGMPKRIEEQCKAVIAAAEGKS